MVTCPECGTIRVDFLARPNIFKVQRKFICTDCDCAFDFPIKGLKKYIKHQPPTIFFPTEF